MSSFSKPTSEQVDAAVAKFHAPQHASYFFDRLTNPNWILPLKDRGFFKTPPEVHEVEGGALRCSRWPQSGYLARMAEVVPDEVSEILAGIRTRNWLVARDILNAAKAMPSSFAVRLVDAIIFAIDQSPDEYLLHDVGEIVAKLAADGQADAAIKLVRSTFSIKRGDTRGSDPDRYAYLEAMQEHVVPSLAASKPEKFIRLVLDWMINALEGTESERNLDSTSWLWRPAIEEHNQNQDSTFASGLLKVLRESCEISIRSGKVSLSDVLAITQKRNEQVFVRLGIHLIAEFGQQNAELARETMMDRELFANPSVKHEYARLLGLRWPLLSASEQERWLSWVEAGPEAIGEDYYDQPDDASRSAMQREYWQFQRLHWIREHLSDERRAFYERMLAENGLPRLADLNVHHGARWGHLSPLSAEDLSTMGFRDAVEAVSQWRPDPLNQGFEAPDVEGLAEEFQKFVGLDPLAASKDAGAMVGRGWLFVRKFLEAMDTAIKEGKEIDLKSVMALARWVVEQPEAQAQPPLHSSRMIDWTGQWCRDTVASLIEKVAQARDAAGSIRFDISHREALWQVVRELPHCPAEEYIGRDLSKDLREADWPMVLLNSTRGKAMLAVFAYVDWLASHLAPGNRSKVIVADGFDAMPEVRELLEGELARPDPDCAGQAAFGWHLGLLLWLDSGWVKANVGRIFDLRAFEGDAAKVHGWAAWSTFLYAHRAHIEFYKILSDQFGYAVEQSLQASGNNREEKVWSRLGEHLMVLFGRGDFGATGEEGLAAEGGLVRRLVTATHVSVRSHAVQYVGTALSGADSPLPQDVIDRYKVLWGEYWRSVGQADAQANPRSAVFGYWFASGAFDIPWSIERLLEFVKEAPRVEPDGLIMEQLAKVCEHDPLRSAQVIQLLVLGDTDGWRIRSWTRDAKQILGVAIRAGGTARNVAEQVIDQLGRRGFLEFGDLVKRQRNVVI